MLLDEENKVLEEETEDEEVEVSPEEEQELEAGIVAGLTDVDTVPLVKESFLDYAMSVITGVVEIHIFTTNHKNESAFLFV